MAVAFGYTELVKMQQIYGVIHNQSSLCVRMAIAGTLMISPLICFNCTEQASSSSSSSRRARRRVPKALTNYNNGRRDLLLLSATALNYVSDSKTDLLNKYLKKSEENKAKNDKERLDSYYKRNYKDYFSLLEGDLKQKKDLSESDKRILEWLDSNK